VAERAQECTERRDFLAHCRPHPYPDHHGFVGVVPEKLGAPTLKDSEQAAPDGALRQPVDWRSVSGLS
jgi:hypothetical protein